MAIGRGMGRLLAPRDQRGLNLNFHQTNVHRDGNQAPTERPASSAQIHCFSAIKSRPLMDLGDAELNVPQRDVAGLSPPAEYHKLVSLGRRGLH